MSSHGFLEDRIRSKLWTFVMPTLGSGLETAWPLTAFSTGSSQPLE
jgi:hypothetical protein